MTSPAETPTATAAAALVAPDAAGAPQAAVPSAAVPSAAVPSATVPSGAPPAGALPAADLLAGDWPLLAYGAAVVGVVAGLMLASWLLGERHRGRGTGVPFESGVDPVGDARLRHSAKFYLVAMMFVIFDVEAVFLFSWAIAVRETGWAGFAEAAVFVGVLLAALAYLWRRGALDWGPGGGR